MNRRRGQDESCPPGAGAPLQIPAAAAGAEGVEDAVAAGFGVEDLAFVEAEVVGDFVPDGLADEAFEGGQGAGGAFVRALVDGDARRGFKRERGGLLRGGAAFEEAQQFGALRLAFHNEDDVLQAASKVRRDDVHALVDEPVEFGGRQSHGHPLL